MRRLLALPVVLAALVGLALAQVTLADLRARAEGGDKVSQFLMGRAYYFGTDGLKKDGAEAIAWFRKAAAQDQVNALTFLGYMSEEGLGGLAKDDAKAAEWYRRAAELGESNAQRNLALMYSDGRGGLAKDDKESLYWYRKAAAQGDPSACNKLGMMYESGQAGLSKDGGEALTWYRKAADKGYAPAQNNAAIILLTSRNPEVRNPRAALDYAGKAVAETPNNVTYLVTLAEAYFVDEQFEKAVTIMQRAIYLTPKSEAKSSDYEAALSRYQTAWQLSQKMAKPAPKVLPPK